MRSESFQCTCVSVDLSISGQCRLSKKLIQNDRSYHTLNITLCLAILCRSFLCRSVGNRQGPQRLLTVYCQTISNKKLQVLHVHISTILDSSISLCHSFHLFLLLFTSCHSTVNKRIICTNIYTHTHTHAHAHTHVSMLVCFIWFKYQYLLLK